MELEHLIKLREDTLILLRETEEKIRQERKKQFTRDTGIDIGVELPGMGRLVELEVSASHSFISGYYLAYKKDGTIGKSRRYVGFQKSVIDEYKQAHKGEN